MGAPGQQPYPPRYPQPYLPQRAKAAAPARSGRAWLSGIGGFVLGMIFMLLLLFFLAPHANPITTSASKGNVTIAIDDTFITRQTARGINQAQLPFTVSNVRAHITAGNTVSIAGDASTPVGSAQFAASTQLSVANGHLISHLTNAEVGAASLPFPVTSALDSAINAQLAQSVDVLLPSSTGLTLTSITTTSGKLTLAVTQR